MEVIISIYIHDASVECINYCRSELECRGMDGPYRLIVCIFDKQNPLEKKQNGSLSILRFIRMMIGLCCRNWTYFTDTKVVFKVIIGQRTSLSGKNGQNWSLIRTELSENGLHFLVGMRLKIGNAKKISWCLVNRSVFSFHKEINQL